MDSHPAAHQLRCVIPIIKLAVVGRFRWCGAPIYSDLLFQYHSWGGGGQNIKDTRQENIGKLFGDYR